MVTSWLTFIGLVDLIVKMRLVLVRVASAVVRWWGVCALSRTLLLVLSGVVILMTAIGMRCWYVDYICASVVVCRLGYCLVCVTLARICRLFGLLRLCVSVVKVRMLSLLLLVRW